MVWGVKVYQCRLIDYMPLWYRMLTVSTAVHVSRRCTGTVLPAQFWCEPNVSRNVEVHPWRRSGWRLRLIKYGLCQGGWMLRCGLGNRGGVNLLARHFLMGSWRKARVKGLGKNMWSRLSFYLYWKERQISMREQSVCAVWKFQGCHNPHKQSKQVHKPAS